MEINIFGVNFTEYKFGVERNIIEEAIILR